MNTSKSSHEIEFREHQSSCSQCAKADKYVNDFCELGFALFMAWSPEPKSVTVTTITPDEFEKLKNDVVNKDRESN